MASLVAQPPPTLALWRASDGMSVAFETDVAVTRVGRHAEHDSEVLEVRPSPP
jgi:hypothetical protein